MNEKMTSCSNLYRYELKYILNSNSVNESIKLILIDARAKKNIMTE